MTICSGSFSPASYAHRLCGAMAIMSRTCQSERTTCGSRLTLWYEIVGRRDDNARVGQRNDGDMGLDAGFFGEIRDPHTRSRHDDH